MQSDQVKIIAEQCDFDDCRIVAAGATDGFGRLLHWLDQGYAGSMAYIENRLDAYQHPSGVMADSRSVIMLLTSYNFGNSRLRQSEVGHGQVASYAASGVDYHDIIHQRSKQMIGELATFFPQSRFRGVVDTAPLLEREFAQRAGFGWIGKNTMLISRKWGSYFFISAILTDLKIQPDDDFVSDHCGTCMRCLEACPTNALLQPRVLDARRCISYLTIENREIAVRELRQDIGDLVFGCDICQQVCPWNRKAEYAIEHSFKPKVEFTDLDLFPILQMDEIEFRQRYRKTPLWRGKLAGIQRNALIVLGNQRASDAIGLIAKLLHSENVMLRLAAAWSLGQMRDLVAQQFLSERLQFELAPIVLDEINLALEF